MKKALILWIGILTLVFVYMSGHVLAEDKSYEIEHVDIHVDVDENGIMHVSELSTFAFDGEFNGTERSILADVSNFKAYEIEESSSDPQISIEGLEELQIENEDDLYRIYISAQDEQKTVLYTYDIENEIKKYVDVADLLYDFYPSSNNVDLGTLTITWELGDKAGNDIDAFVLGNQQGEIELHGSEVVYHHDQFEAGMSAEVRIVFPAASVPGMSLKKDKQMGKKIIQNEQMKRTKREQYDDRLSNLLPFISITLVILLGAMIWWAVIHPNNYKFEKTDDPKKHLTFLEETDPLFVSYMQGHGYVSNMQTALISALLSLKRRGIISMKEVPSSKDKEKMTYAFYWEQAQEGIDEVDAYLRTWLFTEKDGKEQFLFESIILDENEDETVQEEKQEHFTTHYHEWTKLVKNRKAFAGWYEPYRPFKYASVLLTLITFALFYYIVSISPISSMVFPWIMGGMGAVAIMSLIWNRNKWILSFYYFVLITVLFIAATWSIILLPVLGIMLISWLGLLIVSSRKWDPEVAKLVRLNKIASRLFKQKVYPVDANEIINERRLELAITLGKSKEYAEQIGKQLHVEKVGKANTPLLNNPSFAGTVFQPSNVIFYTALSSGNSSTTSIGSSPTGGSGGAGAF